MSEEPIHQPHDKLFKAGFSDPANTAAFLRWEIPLAVSAEVWNISPHFASLLGIPTGLQDELRAFIPDFTFRLIQLRGRWKMLADVS